MSDVPPDSTPETPPPMRFIENPSKFLIDSGLLFEINRRILHPFGLALSMEMRKDNEDEPSSEFNVKVWDCTADPEGITFQTDTFKAGWAKYQAFRKNHRQRLGQRLISLGYLIQGDE